MNNTTLKPEKSAIKVVVNNPEKLSKVPYKMVISNLELQAEAIEKKDISLLTKAHVQNSFISVTEASSSVLESETVLGESLKYKLWCGPETSSSSETSSFSENATMHHHRLMSQANKNNLLMEILSCDDWKDGICAHLKISILETDKTPLELEEQIICYKYDPSGEKLEAVEYIIFDGPNQLSFPHEVKSPLFNLINPKIRESYASLFAPQNESGMSMTLADGYKNIVVPAVMDIWAKDLAKITVKKGDNVLDCACGTGVVTRYASTLAGENGNVIGLDFMPEMLDSAKRIPLPKIGAKVEWVQEDVSKIPYPDNSFDVVTCQFGLMFFPDKVAALKEMRRVLKPRGKIGINVWCSTLYDQVFVKRLAQRVGKDKAIFPIWDYGDPVWLKKVILEAGFLDKNVLLKTYSKPTRYKSIKQSVDIVVAWSEGLQMLDDKEYLELISEMEEDLQESIMTEYLFERNSEANVVIAIKE